MIRSLHEQLRSRKVSSQELTQHYLKRISSDDTNSFITINESEALLMAQAADKKYQNGEVQSLLQGIPLALKDNLVTKGLRTTCASKILGDYQPPYDGVAVGRLRRSGAIFLGKLNMDEFAMGGSNETSAFGPVKNPVNHDYVPGGSSGGSAAAVKAGLAVVTLGSDTGGSIRLPASYTGTVGLKPTYGLVSRYGLVAFASSLDQIGPLTSSSEDAAIVLSAIAGRDPLEEEQDSTLANQPRQDYLAAMANEKGRKLRIGLPHEYFQSGLQAEVAGAIEQVKTALTKAGHVLVDLSLPQTKYSVAVYYVVAVSEASSNLSRFDGVRYGARVQGASLAEMYKKTRSLFGPEVKRRIVLGTFALSSGYYDAYYKKACQVRRLIKEDFDQAFQKCDAILGPVSTSTAFRIGEKISNPLQMYLNDILTIPVNLSGLPALSVPCGRDSNGLPIGVQFIGPAFAESRLLSLGQFVEESVYKEEVDHGF